MFHFDAFLVKIYFYLWNSQRLNKLCTYIRNPTYTRNFTLSCGSGWCFKADTQRAGAAMI